MFSVLNQYVYYAYEDLSWTLYLYSLLNMLKES